MDKSIVRRETLTASITLPAIALRRRLSLRALLPLDNGPTEIRALDGLRAIAALSIVVFHLLLFTRAYTQPWSQAIDNVWYVLATGVQLFFVLSGFLLFRPYARAMLTGGPLPSWLRFYQRRALRILPAYWVALATMLALQWRIAGKPLWLNTLTHALMLHDMFPRYNRDLDGPFWTLAVEVQFYLLLPWIAAGVAKVVGRTASYRRVIAGLVGMIVVALTIRWIGADLMASLPSDLHQAGTKSLALWRLTLLLLGTQGKSLEVFLVGAIAATLYVVATDLKRVSRERLRRVAIALAAIGLVTLAVCAVNWRAGVVMTEPGTHWDARVLLYPLLTGVGYSLALLAIVWGGRPLRAPFEFAPLRFIGLISYSLYVWHLPILHGVIPFLEPVPLAGRLVAIFALSYLSYQLIERPFIRQRRSLRPATRLAPAGA